MEARTGGELARVCRRLRPVFDRINVVTALHRFASLPHVDERENECWQGLVDELLGQVLDTQPCSGAVSAAMAPRELANILWSAAKLRPHLRATGHAPLLDAVLAQLRIHLDCRVADYGDQ